MKEESVTYDNIIYVYYKLRGLCNNALSMDSIAIFQIPQNPMKFGMLTLLIWKNIPMLFFFK